MTLGALKSAALTFEDALEEVLAIQRGSWWPGSRSKAQWRASLRGYALPRLGQMRVDQVATADVMAVLRADLEHGMWCAEGPSARSVLHVVSRSFVARIAGRPRLGFRVPPGAGKFPTVSRSMWGCGVGLVSAGGPAETGVDRVVAEAALAHTVGGVEGAYLRSDLFARRREVMQAWSDYLRL